MNSGHNQILNSPLEVSLRLLLILVMNNQDKYDIEKLSYYDYISTNIGDFVSEHRSLHPKSPYRKGEIAIKRPLVKSGIMILIRKGLVRVHYTTDGFQYSAGEYAEKLTDQFSSEYALELKKHIKLASELLQNKSNVDLRKFFESFTRERDNDFKNESILRGV